jgi:hypothetical protein
MGVLFALDATDTFGTVRLLVALSVIAAGIGVQIASARIGLRRRTGVVRPVLTATIVYWLTVSAGWIIGWPLLISDHYSLPVVRNLSAGLQDLPGLWMVAAITAGFVVGIAAGGNRLAAT